MFGTLEFFKVFLFPFSRSFLTMTGGAARFRLLSQWIRGDRPRTCIILKDSYLSEYENEGTDQASEDLTMLAVAERDVTE